MTVVADTVALNIISEGLLFMVVSEASPNPIPVPNSMTKMSKIDT